MNQTKNRRLHNIFRRTLACLLVALSVISPIAVFGDASPLAIAAAAADYSYNYYPRYTGNSGSLVDALKAVGVNASFSNRKAIAVVNGYPSYSGTAAQNRDLLAKLKRGVLIKSKTEVVRNDWQISTQSAITVEQGKSATIDIQFMGTGISNYGGSYTNPSALSVYFTNPVWKPAGQWCSVKLVVTGKAAGTSTVTFKLAGTRSLSKSITVNVVNNSNSLVDANLSKISYIKQGYDTCKASSAAMALNLVTGKDTYTTSNMGGSCCKGINGNRYTGSNGKTYVATYKTDSYLGSASEQKNAINAALSNGTPIVVAVHSTRSGYTKHHWIVIVGKSGNDYLAVDPASKGSGVMSNNVKSMTSLHYGFGLTDYRNGTHYGYISFSKV